MTWFLSACFWALLALFQFILGLLMRAFMCVLWFFWPAVLVGVLVFSAQSCEAGWFSWLWGGSNTKQLERSLDVAEEAARVANEASQAQAQQAVAQAEQNARLAETLGQLSSERSNLADHLHALTELGLQDSQWAAAVSASGPVLVCITVLAVAGLALWLVNKSGEGHDAELAQTVDLLVEELAAYGPQNEPRVHGGARLVGPRAHKDSSRALTRLPVLAGLRVDDSAPDGDGTFPEDMTPDEPNAEDDSGPMPF